MRSMLHKATTVAALATGLFISSGASYDAELGANATSQVELTDWIEVRRADPILGEPELDADALLAATAGSVAAFTRYSSGITNVDADRLAEHLAHDLPGSRVSLSVLADEYIWYVDENGTPVRVCLGVEELTISFTASGQRIVVRIRRQLEI